MRLAYGSLLAPPRPGILADFSGRVKTLFLHGSYVPGAWVRSSLDCLLLLRRIISSREKKSPLG